MKNETLLKGGFGMSLLLCVVLLFLFLEQKTKVTDVEIKLNQQINISDSLHNELFYLTVESGRQEITRDYFFTKYPKLQVEYENYYNHETE